MTELALVHTESTVARATFDDFWTLYPRRVARKDALNAWAKVREVDRVACLVALVDWRQVWRARGDDQFVPHAATWLNGERWTDEIPVEFTRPTHASHVAAKQLDQTERGPIPPRVLEALAKLRKGHT